MKNYEVQDGCHNCKYCFTNRPFDDPVTYHCLRTKEESRPNPPNDDLRNSNIKEWSEKTFEFETWIYHLEQVSAAGICDLFELSKHTEKI